MTLHLDRSTWLRLLVGFAALHLAVACGDDGAPDALQPPDEASTAPTTADAVATTSEAPATTAPPGSEVESTGTFGPPTMLEPACAGEACVFPLTRESSTSAGSFTGSAVSGGVGIPLSDGGYTAVGIRLFEGEVDGCGAGTMIITETLTSDSGTEASGTWSIVESSGTGDLAGIAGGGTFEAQLSDDGGGVSESSGTITCDGG